MKILRTGLFFLFLASTVNADTIIIASDNWCPVSCAPGSIHEGFMVDIAKTVFGKAGHSVDYQIIPWNRTLREVRKGKIHGAIGAYTDDCPDFIFPENELALISFKIFINKKSTWQFNDLSSLENISIGVISDYSYGKELDRYIKKNKANSAKIQVMFGNDPLKKNIKKLTSKRIDALIATEPVFWYTVKKLNMGDHFKSAGIINPPEKAYIAFSPALPASKKYAKMLSNGVDELRKSGKLEKILHRYGLTDWK